MNINTTTTPVRGFAPPAAQPLINRIESLLAALDTNAALLTTSLEHTRTTRDQLNNLLQTL